MGDTIIALSSGALPSGVAVVRASGPHCTVLAQHLLGDVPPPRRMVRRKIGGPDNPLDDGLAVYFPGPASFTGEDCLELHLHGSPAVLRATLRAMTAYDGVRLADAGEFTRRAFINGKLDLTEVEGIGDLLQAETESQRAQALARMAGGIADRIGPWRTQLLDLRAEIEAHLDFSDEGDVGPELDPHVYTQITALRNDITALEASVSGGRILREGLRVALAGPPNAGKSSLLNALARSELAIVTDEAGTTRDIREVPIDINGRLVILLDMAGLRETDSKAEAEGIARARQEIAQADLVLWLDATDLPAQDPQVPADVPVWRLATKIDLAETIAAQGISARAGTGLDALVRRLGAFADAAIGTSSGLVSRERDRQSLIAAQQALTEALLLRDQPELMAESLRRASYALERLLGRLDAEAVLDHLFAAFCIGK